MLFNIILDAAMSISPVPSVSCRNHRRRYGQWRSSTRMAQNFVEESVKSHCTIEHDLFRHHRMGWAVAQEEQYAFFFLFEKKKIRQLRTRKQKLKAAVDPGFWGDELDTGGLLAQIMPFSSENARVSVVVRIRPLASPSTEAPTVKTFPDSPGLVNIR
jgi:hypothetical protein